MVHVPYRGQAPTTPAVFAGEVDILLTTTSDTLTGQQGLLAKEQTNE